MIWYAFCLLFQGYLSKSVYAERDGTLSMVLGFERRVLISLDDAAKPLKHFEKVGFQIHPWTVRIFGRSE
ncbi:hypothetical protein C1H46_009712 [Malus baccata]|uniref:Uncharacterized protein n=1 Tax=Malus baccata TaxID=106549 RepID=A0A540N155_MALBA|nr:hypothetical protein C1H46_009712 [Malus baccata]